MWATAEEGPDKCRAAAPKAGLRFMIDDVSRHLCQPVELLYTESARARRPAHTSTAPPYSTEEGRFRGGTLM